MDTAQWPQELLMKPSMEEMIPNTTCSNIISNNNNNNDNSNNSVMNNNNNSKGATSSTSLERKVRPQKDEAVNCPRCNSTNTKFCYYNNYSLTQPRYFCKTCRRYWTEGGSLRNIPVGGGSRKNKRSSSSSTSPSSKKLSTHHDHHHDHHHLLTTSTQPHHHHQNPNKFYHHHQQGQDLNLGFPPNHQQEFRSLSEFMQLPTIETTTTPTKSHQIPNSDPNNNTTTTTTSSNVEQQNNHHHHLSALELLNGLTSSRGLTPFMPMPVPDPNGVYSSGFQMHDFKPSLNFSLVDGLGNGYGGLQGDEPCETTTTNNNSTTSSSNNNNNNGRLLFPFEDLKQVSSNTSADHHTTNNSSADNHHHHHHHHDLNGEQGDSTHGYWSGMLGNEGSW